MKRVLLFVLTNVAVMVVLSAVVYLLGLDKYLSGRGGMGGLLVVAAIFGFGGAFISLAMSKWIAKRSMGVHVIEQPANATEKWLVDTVRAYAKEAHIGMPEVGVFDSPEPNAFATGMRKDSALVAVSTGLLNRMRKEEVEAVIGHEVAHVANGDMVTLTLIQGVVNTFVFFIARVIGNIVDNATRGNSERSGPGMAYFATVIFAEIVLGILASMIVMYFSRQREFRADHGGAWLAGRQNMIGALEALQRQREPQGLPANMAAFGINGGVPSGLRKLFMSHPPLEERIAVLKAAA
ncbi:MAG: protease HtpX [Proteobacteria bacterium]|jgi:heat shock protein HtpX|nr:protease HtpX [Pseudomonadota bacterium]MBK7117489.1 protease HtpX [Pseudomonadota bacterium]MBK9251257.1 protease HtpX [Pseudomonadota bacterium]MCC6632709.1 protease HtpX [Gammaproteobacteria bacterium]